MKASIVDLRYKMKEVLKALKRKEAVHILYHGKEAGVIVPAKTRQVKKVVSHPFFGLSKEPASARAVEKELEKLRAPRHHDL